MGVAGQVAFSGSAGLADIESQLPASPKTRFRIFSTSKTFGAVVAMMLAEAGALSLDAPISLYLAGLPAHIHEITVRQLLAHRAGIRHYRDGEWDKVSSRNCAGPKLALPDFIEDPLEFSPGDGYRYTTYGYVLLSAVLEAASGIPFDELVKKNILEPAGMTSTAIEGRALAGKPIASFYDRGDDGKFKEAQGIDSSCKFFGGGFVSTSEDLVRFGLALVNGRLVSADSLKVMWKIHSEGGSNYPPYGYGFIPGEVMTVFGVLKEDVVPSWWHGGNGRGGYSVLILYPKHKAAAAIVTNVKATGRLVRATHQLALPYLRRSAVQMESIQIASTCVDCRR